MPRPVLGPGSAGLGRALNSARVELRAKLDQEGTRPLGRDEVSLLFVQAQGILEYFRGFVGPAREQQHLGQSPSLRRHGR